MNQCFVESLKPAWSQLFGLTHSLFGPTHWSNWIFVSGTICWCFSQACFSAKIPGPTHFSDFTHAGFPWFPLPFSKIKSSVYGYCGRNWYHQSGQTVMNLLKYKCAFWVFKILNLYLLWHVIDTSFVVVTSVCIVAANWEQKWSLTE